MTAATIQRQTRQLLKAASAKLAGRERGADRAVRRNSYDIDDARAQVFKPIGDGTIAGALSWIDCLLKTVGEWDDIQRRAGGARPLGLFGVRVLEVLLGRKGGVAIDFRTGRLDPAIDTIARVGCMSRTTVVRALASLKRLGILDWVRRTTVAETQGQKGPQREQISNAYFFDVTKLPGNVLARFRSLLERKRRNRLGTAPPPTPNAETSTADVVAATTDPELRATLERMEATLRNASPPSGQYHGSGVKG